MEMTEKITTQRLTVPCYDTDVSHYLKPGAFMDMAQEIANVSADSLGFGFDALQRYGTAWVLSRFEAHFLAMPRWKDAVTAFIGVNLKDAFIGYAYDYPVSAISKATFGSHEVFVSYNVKLDMGEKNRNSHKSIRIM